MGLINWIKSAWRGGERLWKVFWLGALAIYAFVFILGILFAFLPIGPATYALWYVVCFSMSVWWWVSVWRCAPNSGWPLWKYLSRIVVVLQVLNLFVTLALLSQGMSTGVVTYEGYETIR